MIIRNPKFKALYTTDKRYILLTGGRGSAKSFEASTFLCLLSYELNQKILFTRYTMKSAEESIIPEFKSKISLMQVDKDFYCTKEKVYNLTTKSEILFRGIKTSSGIQTANLKSLNDTSCFVVDEAEEFTDEEVYDTIDLSVRTKKTQNRSITIMNPSNKSHWVYKKYFVGHSKIEFVDGLPIEISTHPDVLHIHTTYFDNLRNVSETWLKKMQSLKEKSLKYYGHKALGQWLDVAEGSLFSNLKTYKQDSKYEFEATLAFIDVADEGDDYLCMVIGKNVGEVIYIIDVVLSTENTDITIPLCIAAAKKHGVNQMRVESNSMGGMFARMVEKGLPGVGVYTSVSTVHKHTRILMDNMFINEFMRFKQEQNRSAEYHEYIMQMAMYTKDGEADHDDAPDATQGLAQFFRLTLSHWE